jgi:hypothetical protein
MLRGYDKYDDYSKGDLHCSRGESSVLVLKGTPPLTQAFPAFMKGLELRRCSF